MCVVLTIAQWPRTTITISRTKYWRIVLVGRRGFSSRMFKNYGMLPFLLNVEMLFCGSHFRLINIQLVPWIFGYWRWQVRSLMPLISFRLPQNIRLEWSREYKNKEGDLKFLKAEILWKGLHVVCESERQIRVKISYRYPPYNILTPSKSNDKVLFVFYIYVIRYIVSRGKMEHGGKMEHRMFWKKYAWCGSIFTSIWFLLSASSVSHIEIKLTIDYVLSISRKRNFTFLIYQLTSVLTSIALTN